MSHGSAPGENSLLRYFKFGENILRFRWFIGGFLLLFTLWMLYCASQVKIATRFVDFFPRNHPNVLLTNKYAAFGGADTVTFMVEVKNGDIFNTPTLKIIQDLTRDINRLPGVNHNEVFSLASYRVTYAKAVPGALVAKTFMYPNLPNGQAELDLLKRNVTIYRDRIGSLVSPDNRAAVVRASFNEEGFNYKELFFDIRGLVKKYQDPNHEIFVAGEPIVRGYGYYYEPAVVTILVASVIAMILILYLFLAQRSRWWAPIVTGTFSAIWGLGFVGLMGYDFDPVMLVIPFILTARDVSHGIQWQGRYYDEIDRLRDKYAACIATTDQMLPPGFLSIIADIAGIVFIALGGIPVLEHIGFAGAVWLAGSLTMVFVFQPILMSFLPLPEVRSEAKRVTGIYMWIEGLFAKLAEIPVTPGRRRASILVIALIVLIWGVASGLREPVGYVYAGTPLYRPSAKVNRDLMAINHYFPTDEGWVIVANMPPFPDPQSALAPGILRMSNDLHNYLLQDRDLDSVVTFASRIIMPSNMMLHYGHPKFLSIPDDIQLSGNLQYLYSTATAPGEMEQYLAPPAAQDTCIRILMPGHTTLALDRLRQRLNEFVKERVSGDPNLNKIKVLSLGSTAGLYAAADDVLKQLDFLNITFVLAAVCLFSMISFRSVVAGLLFLLACVLANFGAFIYLRLRDIGLTIDTIPVISLGIGLGIDYGIYTVARIRDEVIGGMSLNEAIRIAITKTGTSVFSTFSVMVGGIALWAFSPLLFHSEMSVLLMFLMGTNMIAGVLVLPCYIAWARPKFVVKHEQVQTQAAAGGN
ncbi:MAG: MMPL family transporter [Candidatus Binataceae bacterium]|nr:MMPL family transporter [Candidatus Binataceae bacterium]